MTYNIFAAVLAIRGSGKTANFTPCGPPKPSSAMPGTRERIAVMVARVEAGKELWSDQDRTEIGEV